jgi:hypothetical protein
MSAKDLPYVGKPLVQNYALNHLRCPIASYNSPCGLADRVSPAG